MPLQALEELHHAGGIDTRLHDQLHTTAVRLFLISPAVAEVRQGRGAIGRNPPDAAHIAGHNGEEEGGGKVPEDPLCGVPLHDVDHLVGEHPGKLLRTPRLP